MTIAMPDGGHAVEGVSNFRDFGGHVAAEGTRMIAGRLFRSANPATISPTGVAQLESIGIRTVIDLRGGSERRKAMVRLDPAAIAIRAIPIEPKTSGRIREALASGARADDMRVIMIAAYRGYVVDEAASFGAALIALAEAAHRPVLVHCTAGKDRTGFLAAVLQSALGVSREIVVADYLRTNIAWDRASALGHLPGSPELLEPVLTADAAYLDAAFAAIADADGDVAGFLRRATDGAVSRADLSHLVEPESRP